MQKADMIMEKSFYEDKVRGGWFGKCLGGLAGMHFEGFPFSPNMTVDDIPLIVLSRKMI